MYMYNFKRFIEIEDYIHIKFSLINKMGIQCKPLIKNESFNQSKYNKINK